MKRTLMLFTLFIAGTLLAAPAWAQRGYGGGMGRWQRPNPESMNKEDFTAYEEAWQKHYEDTADLHQQLWLKRHEMATLLANPDSPKKELLDKQAELQKLTNELQQKELSFRWDLYKKFPQMAPDNYGGCYGPGMGYGEGWEMGPGMGYGGGWGMGPGWGGYGYGPGMMDDDYDEYGPGMMRRGWGR